INTITIFSDTSSLEIFINEGQYSLSTRLYEDQNDAQISSNIELKGHYYLLGEYKINESNH
ncbi:MAG: GH32 C-terminal domain-containing protein, partial [Coprobacillus sp.]